jgi:hypothetical protein
VKARAKEVVFIEKGLKKTETKTKIWLGISKLFYL